MKKIGVLLLLVLFVLVSYGSALAQEAVKAPAAPAGTQPAPPDSPAVPPPPPKPQPTVENRIAAVGDKAIEFSLFDTSEEKLISFSDLNKGTKKVLAIVFLNSTCASCTHEAELIASMKKKYQDDLNLVAVVTDLSAKIYHSAVSENVKKAFTAVLDPKFQVPPAYGFSYTPGLVIVKGGKVSAIKGGFIPGKDEKEVVDLIKNSM